jgi:O-antigen/teichoic acid export membrane protein
MTMPTKEEMLALEVELKKAISNEKLQLIRNSYLAGSALALTILIALTQVMVSNPGLEISKISSALAMPLCSGLAYLINMYIHLGEAYLEKYNDFRTNFLYAFLQVIASASLVAAVGGITYYLSTWTAIVFGASITVAVLFFMYGYGSLASNRKNKKTLENDK